MGWFPGSSSWPELPRFGTRRDPRMNLGLVHGYGRLRRHPNHSPARPPNFQPACRDYFVTWDGHRVACVTYVTLVTPVTGCPQAPTPTRSPGRRRA